MAQIKHLKRPAVDYPTGRGSGLPAAGVHTPDRRLGALPIPPNMSGYGGSPSTAADMGFSRITQRVMGTSEEVKKRVEAIPEISWLKQNEKGLEDLGLTSRVVMEIYTGIMLHQPRDRYERMMIENLRKRVAATQGRISLVTEAALRARPLTELLDPGTPIGDIVAGFLQGNDDNVSSVVGRAVGPAQRISAAPERDEDLTPSEVSDTVDNSDSEMLDNFSPAQIETGSRGLASDSDMTSKALSCHSSAVQALHVGLAILGVVGDFGSIFGVPVGVAADITNCVINLVCGNFFYAFIDLVAVIPFIGDTAKIGYLSRVKSLSPEKFARMKAATNPADKGAIAREIWDQLRSTGGFTPGVTKFLDRLDKTFKTGGEAAQRLGKLLIGYLDNAISYLERAQTGAGSGIAASAIEFFSKGKMSIDIARVLKNVRDIAIPKFMAFIKGLLGTREARASYASRAELGAATAELSLSDDSAHTPDMESMSDDADMMDIDVDEPAAEQMGQDSLDSDDIDSDDIDDAMRGRQYPVAQYPGARDYDGDGLPDFGGPSLRGRSRLREGAVSSKSSRKAPKKMSLVSAMSGDDDAVDEMSVSAGVANVVLPLGMSTPGKHDPVKASTGYKRVKS